MARPAISIPAAAGDLDFALARGSLVDLEGSLREHGFTTLCGTRMLISWAYVEDRAILREDSVSASS